jgi:hypothetical protein
MCARHKKDDFGHVVSYTIHDMGKKTHVPVRAPVFSSTCILSIRGKAISDQRPLTALWAGGEAEKGAWIDDAVVIPSRVERAHAHIAGTVSQRHMS